MAAWFWPMKAASQKSMCRSVATGLSKFWLAAIFTPLTPLPRRSANVSRAPVFNVSCLVWSVNWKHIFSRLKSRPSPDLPFSQNIRAAGVILLEHAP